MKFKSLGYCFIQGIKNIGRNRIFSLASVATMSLCIFIFGVAYSLTSNIQYMVDNMSNTLCIKVFFENDTTADRIESIGNSIKKFNGVTGIHYTSPDEAWENYKELYFGDEYKDLAEGFENDNPLANSSSYEVYFANANIQRDLVEYIEKIDGVRKTNSSEVTADSLSEVTKLVKLVSGGMLLILLLIALFLINNTISIGIKVREEEIKIMRLLGAKNGFIRAPFVVEGLVIGILGAGIPTLVIYFGYGYIVEYIFERFSFISTVLTFMPVEEMFRIYLPIAAILGIGLGFLGSLISLGRHLKA